MIYTKKNPLEVKCITINSLQFTNKAVHDFSGVVLSFYGDYGWYEDGVLSRTDGPAVEWYNGKIEYWFKGNGYLQCKEEWSNRLKKEGIQPTLEYFKNLL